MPEPKRRYTFDWSLLGDVDKGRPNMGPTASIEVYRLMQFCFRDAIEQRVGTLVTDEIFYEAGRIAGRALFDNKLVNTLDFDAFVKQLQALLREMRMGILRVEHVDDDKRTLVVTMSEDLECSGLPELDYETCKYDEGLLAGLLESFTGKTYVVREVDCWTTGDRTCRFVARVIDDPLPEED